MANPAMGTYKGVLACLINCATAAETGGFLKLNSEIDKYKQSLEDLKKTSSDKDQDKIRHLEEFGKKFSIDLLDTLRYTGDDR